MTFDYFYGRSAEQFAFYQIPKLLITDERFAGISTDAKLLYSLMLDRAALSVKNGWMDPEGRVYIIYTLEQIMADMRCANQKATKMLRDLDRIGLIERKKHGQGKPTQIFVKDFATDLSDERPEASLSQTHENHDSENPDNENPDASSVQNHENHDSKDVKVMTQGSWKSCAINTDINKTENSETDPIYPSAEAEEEADGSDEDPMKERRLYENYFRRKLEIDCLLEKYPYDQGRIHEILDLLVDTLCSKAKTIRVAGEDRPAEVVKSRFMKLDYSYIEYILDCFHDQISDIRNIKQYMLAMLYNAPLTIDHYYTAKVHHDMANWNPDEHPDFGMGGTT